MDRKRQIRPPSRLRQALLAPSLLPPSATTIPDRCGGGGGGWAGSEPEGTQPQRTTAQPRVPVGGMAVQLLERPPRTPTPSVKSSP